MKRILTWALVPVVAAPPILMLVGLALRWGDVGYPWFSAIARHWPTDPVGTFMYLIFAPATVVIVTFAVVANRLGLLSANPQHVSQDDE